MPLVLELPDMGGQPGAGLVTVPAVALVLGDPVPDLAVREPSVGFLLACGGVGHLRRVHHSLRQAVARYWALSPPSVAVAASCGLLLAL